MKISWSLCAFVPALFAVFLFTGCQAFMARTTNPEESVLQRGIPPGSERVHAGIGRFTFEFENSGRAYLYDPQRDEVVARYQVRAGQRLAVDAGAGEVTLDGTPVRSDRLRRGDTYHIYLLPMENGGVQFDQEQFDQENPQPPPLQPQGGGGAAPREGETPGLGAVSPWR